MIARILAWIAKFKKGPAAKLPLVPATVAVVSALLASAAVNNLTFLANANQFIADGETAAFTPQNRRTPTSSSLRSPRTRWRNFPIARRSIVNS